MARSIATDVSFRAMVADSFYDEDRDFRRCLERLGVGYVLSLKKSHCWWHMEGTIGALWETALATGWEDTEGPGEWTKVVRRFRDGHREVWWALEVEAGPYGKERARRALVVTTDHAIRRHRQLVCCAFSFCWWAYGRLPASPEEPAEQPEDDLSTGSSARRE